eukprot:TRINITY_DN6866_c0_g1_i4.p1 TRINITY_DN6866_c0_g1~~TRINITY_DN6866_c0_g1_i4.p1  ORF type:complete len:1313 (+),score=349.16 TRINITY_DN6866_c0_g1_i4:205-4143(+)
MGTVLRTSPINLWLIGITFLVLFSEQWPRAVATATSGSRIISESLNLGLNAPKLDERSLRNRNEKELAALHQPLIQPAQAGGGTPHVSITPPFLEFGARPICIPVVHTIEVINTSEEKELTLFSITTDSAHYHPPIFKQTVLAPLGKTMIAVIFVPRVLGRLDGKLVIKTSLGGFLYQAHGEGLPNPYKVFPLVSAKVPVGVPYSPSMKLFNPFDEPLHVKEVYTSEGFLHLELPKVQNEEEAGQAGMWELMPQQHKTVIHLNFKSQSAGKFQGFVHMKTDKDNLVIPVEIVATKGGVHRTPEELDFGTLTTPSERKTLTLSLHNSGTVPLRCTDMYMLSPDSHLLVDFKKYTILAPGQETVLARVTYRGHTEGQFSGKLLVRLNNTNLANSRVEIPYRARVLHGSLGYSQANTTFPVGPYPFEPVTKELYITNKFPLALVILAASVSDRNFTLLGFEPQVVIRPGHTMKVLSIQFLASSPDMLHHSALSLVTNASTLQIPLQCYHGRLLFSVPDLSNTQSKASEQKVVDFGVFGVHDERVKLFNLTNLNPMKISLQYRPSEQAAAGDSSKLSLWPRGVWNTQHKHTPHPHASSWSTSDDPVIELEPGHSALFSIKVSSVREENVSSVISFSTQHENFTVAVKYQSVNASVQFSPQPIRFEQSFPGAKLTHSLMARSTCDRPLTIVSIASSDPRMVPVLTKQVLEPNQLMQVGHLVFNPSKAPSERNYMQLLPGHWKDEEEISLAGEPLSHEDLEAWSARDDLWNEMRTIGSQKIHATIVVDTDVVMGSRLTVHGGLFKPTVVAVQHAESSFGLTQVGAVAEKFVHVHNPADVAVHMKLAQVRPNSSLANSSMSSHIGLIAPRMLYSNDFELSAAAMEGLLIPPHSKSKLGPIFFKPSSLTSVNATLFVKNNLTILDPIIMHGEGGSGFFHFKDGLNLLDTLKIELNESDFRVHLDKHKAAQGTNTQPSPVFFQRSFRATNNGNLPIEVLGIEVNGRGCVAYGFEIFNCSSFTLQPDESTSIVLSFQPDYSASVIRRELFVTTTLGIQRVPVEVTLPHELLPELAAVLSPGDSFSGMRQLCLIAAAVALVLISHLSLSDLLTSSSDVAAVPVKIGVFLADTPDVPPAVDKQDPPQVSINKDDKAPVPQPQPESNAAPAEASTAQKLPKVKKALPVENKPKPNKEEPPAREPVAAQSEEVVKPKSKKEKDREKAERDKAERDRRELERAEKAWAEAEAKKLLKQEAQAKREKEAALRREAQLEAQRAQLEAQREAKTKREAEWKVESKRKKDCLLYTSPSPRDRTRSRMPSSA